MYKIRYKSVDKLGNEEAPKTVTYNMIGAIPIIDLFVSNGKSNEEQVRTHYLEQPTQPSNNSQELNQDHNRSPASETPSSSDTLQNSLATKPDSEGSGVNTTREGASTDTIASDLGTNR